MHFGKHFCGGVPFCTPVTQRYFRIFSYPTPMPPAGACRIHGRYRPARLLATRDRRRRCAPRTRYALLTARRRLAARHRRTHLPARRVLARGGPWALCAARVSRRTCCSTPPPSLTTPTGCHAGSRRRGPGPSAPGPKTPGLEFERVWSVTQSVTSHRVANKRARARTNTDHTTAPGGAGPQGARGAKRLRPGARAGLGARPESS